MPGPAVTAVYVVGAIAVVASVVAFKEFVYEPHIAPKLEAWAESFVDNRRRQRARRQGPISAQPVHEHGDENTTRRSTRSRNDDNRPHPPFGSGSDKKRGDDDEDDDNSMSVELEQLVAREGSAWSEDGRQNGLRHRKTAGTMDESNVFIPYRPMSPTHVIFDSSVTSTPTSPSSSGSRLQSPRGATTPVLHGSSPRSRLSSVTSRNAAHIPPTPVSIRSAASSRIQSPNMMDAMSSRSSSPDAPAMYNTALMGSIGNLSERASASPRTEPFVPTSRVQSPLSDYHLAAPVPSLPASRIQSPFSDIHAAVARSPTLSARSGVMSPFTHMSEPESDFDLPSDSEDDVMSLRSGMFSPSMSSRQEELAFDVMSVHGSEGSSWGSVGRRTPDL
ncbi:uncharacterized protein B0H18DRAFT_1122342 [Fomitopsis serialis]|uniref:uncharacterized protein n=1 Tax=Fomitopsis serialis TaxID=139415 RepID=UPI0020081767|nr:uncharacterized protein B0H18DRAFT_1122342 [Neoantrodia serialis]KAH9919698.1 hypothetical protein B0H18DRAFT_1122342 [Neoantrodia serialis]